MKIKQPFCTEHEINPDEHVIPVMVGSLRDVWEQPHRSHFLITPDTALVREDVFMELREYSHSYPSGVFAGKMWRSVGDDGKNYFHWFTRAYFLKGRSVCDIEKRLAIFQDWKSLYGI